MTKPTTPAIGAIYVDPIYLTTEMYTGSSWVIYDPYVISRLRCDFKMPTEYQLLKYPALKDAWDNFLMVKNLVGV